MNEELREQLSNFLSTAQAHMTFAEAVKDFPMEKINDNPPHVAYTPWHLLEHIRRTQSDLLEFMIAKKYQEKEWPKDYWPKKDTKATTRDWQKTIKEYEADLQKIMKLVNDKKIDLFEKVPNGDTQSYLREVLLAIDHTAYHIGEFAILRQVMGTWKK